MSENVINNTWGKNFYKKCENYEILFFEDV